MFKRIKRELYLLPRGEQRALLLLSLLLILGILLRVTVQVIPGRVPPDMERFVEESRAMLSSMAGIDSLDGTQDSIYYTAIDHTPTGQATGGYRVYPVRKPEPIPINSADSLELLPLPGIGPVFAGRIIRYRNLLGGYISVDQLSEVYGLPPETLQRIAHLIEIDTAGIRKLDLNHATFGELLRHPYLQYEDVRALVNFRDSRGGISSLQEVRDHQILHDSVLLKAGPYLQILSE